MLMDLNWRRTEEERKVYLVLEDITEESGWIASRQSAGKRISRNRMLHRVGASADLICDTNGYRLLKTPYVFSIIAGRKVEQLRRTCKRLISLSRTI
jgi:hypothetical protein